MSDWLLDTFIATTALIAFVLLVREPTRWQFGSRVTYSLWLIPAARLLMPTLTTTVERTVPRGATVQPLVSEPLLQSNPAMPESSLLVRLGGWTTILLAVWLAVALALFVSRMIAFHRDRRAILSAGTQVDRVGSVRIVSSSEVLSPVAFGILDRVIAFPADFDRNYAIHERHLALEHELAHHRSGDLIANLLAFVLLCLQWFNPLAWVAHAAFRFDQEAACDARVLDRVKALDRADYGRTIAKAASGRALLFVSALGQGNRLHRRLSAMLRHSTFGRRVAGRFVILATVAAALPLTATRAIDYVDIAAPAVPKVPSTAALAKVPVVISVQPAGMATSANVVRPGAPVQAAQLDSVVDDNGQTITIDMEAITRQALASLDERQFDVAIDDRQIDAAADAAAGAIDDRQIDAAADAAAEHAKRAIDRLQTP